QDVHEPQVDTVHCHGASDRLERVEPPHLAEPPTRVGLLLQHLERQPARRAPVATPLLRKPGEVRRLLVRFYPPAFEQHLQVVERDHRVRSSPRSVRHTPAYTTGVSG